MPRATPTNCVARFLVSVSGWSSSSSSLPSASGASCRSFRNSAPANSTAPTTSPYASGIVEPARYPDRSDSSGEMRSPIRQ